MKMIVVVEVLMVSDKMFPPEIRHNRFNDTNALAESDDW